ncbi:MAG: hypothetical protein ACLRWP_17560 [Bilophila wadsworthia]
MRWPRPGSGGSFREPALFPWLTALENVEIGLEAAGVSHPPLGVRGLSTC